MKIFDRESNKLKTLNNLRHPRTTRYIAKLAIGSKVNMDTGDVHHLDGMLATARWADDLVDEEKIYDLESYIDQILNPSDEGSSAEFSTIPKEYLSQLPESWQETVRKSVVGLGVSAINRLEASTAEEYTWHTLEESRLFAEIIQVRDSDGADAAAREHFNEWLVRYARAGYALDTVSDSVGDYKQGITRIPPTVGNYGHFIRVAFDEMQAMLPGAPKGLVRHSGQRIVTKFVEKGKKRFAR